MMRSRLFILISIVSFLTMTACSYTITMTRTVAFDLPWSTSEPIWTSVPTIENAPSPTITPTWSSCEIGNYWVRTTTRLRVRQQTTSNTQDPLQQAILIVVPEGELLEVDTCLIEVTPPGWFPVFVISAGRQGIVDSRFIDTRTEPPN